MIKPLQKLKAHDYVVGFLFVYYFQNLKQKMDGYTKIEFYAIVQMKSASFLH
jgi:hypothetical protein